MSPTRYFIFTPLRCMRSEMNYSDVISNGIIGDRRVTSCGIDVAVLY
jgi:hypothetical protein